MYICIHMYTGAVMFIFAMAVWNGANYYIEVFSKSYDLKYKDSHSELLSPGTCDMTHVWHNSSICVSELITCVALHTKTLIPNSSLQVYVTWLIYLRVKTHSLVSHGLNTKTLIPNSSLQIYTWHDSSICGWGLVHLYHIEHKHSHSELLSSDIYMTWLIYLCAKTHPRWI